MASSWTTNGKATTAGSLLAFEDNVGEDGLSSQSTYKLNIDCPYYKASIAPNPKVLNDLKPSKEQLENIYWGIVKELNDLRLQINSKQTLSCIDCQGKSFNTNIAEVPARNVVFLASWWWARGALSMSITYRRPAEPSSGEIWAGVNMLMLLIPTLILHIFWSQLVPHVGCDMVLGKN